jgi:hypothetical protein
MGVQDVADQAVGGTADRDTRWWRPALLTLGGVAGVGVALAVGASMASASPHSSAAVSSSASSASSGVTLCAKHSGAVVYRKESSCPHGDTRLSLGDQSQVSKLSGEVSSLTSQNATLRSKESTDASDISALQAQVATLTADESTDASNISTLQSKVGALDTLTTGMTRTEDPDSPIGQDWPLLTISGENVEVNDGSGHEDSTNGLGNLIVGYDSDDTSQVRSGSNNLIAGDGNSWRSYGGLIAGQGNVTLAQAPYSSVTGGQSNAAAGEWSSVSGGNENYAAGQSSSISGGQTNSTFGDYSSISGGDTNNAEGEYSSATGGYRNYAGDDPNDETVGEWSWVGGGTGNEAQGKYSSIVGGQGNGVSGLLAVLLGGYNQPALSGNCATLPAVSGSTTGCNDPN